MSTQKEKEKKLSDSSSASSSPSYDSTPVESPSADSPSNEKEVKWVINHLQKLLKEKENLQAATSGFVEELKNPSVNTPTSNLQEMREKIEKLTAELRRHKLRVRIDELERINPLRVRINAADQQIEAESREIEGTLTKETSKAILELDKVPDTDLRAQVEAQDGAEKKLSKFNHFALVISNGAFKRELLSSLKKNLDVLKANCAETQGRLLSLTAPPSSATTYATASDSVPVLLPEEREEDSDNEESEALAHALRLSLGPNDQKSQPLKDLAKESNSTSRSAPAEPVTPSAAIRTETSSPRASVSVFFSQSSSSSQTQASSPATISPDVPQLGARTLGPG